MFWLKILLCHKNALICTTYPGTNNKTCNDGNVERENECKLLIVTKFSSDDHLTNNLKANDAMKDLKNKLFLKGEINKDLSIFIRTFVVRCEACNFPKINTPPWVFFMFFKLYKWYQIAQRITFLQ